MKLESVSGIDIVVLKVLREHPLTSLAYSFAITAALFDMFDSSFNASLGVFISRKTKIKYDIREYERE